MPTLKERETEIEFLEERLAVLKEQYKEEYVKQYADVSKYLGKYWYYNDNLLTGYLHVVEIDDEEISCNGILYATHDASIYSYINTIFIVPQAKYLRHEITEMHYQEVLNKYNSLVVSLEISF